MPRAVRGDLTEAMEAGQPGATRPGGYTTSIRDAGLGQAVPEGWEPALIANSRMRLAMKLINARVQ